MQKVKDTLKKVTGKGHEHETGYAHTGTTGYDTAGRHHTGVGHHNTDVVGSGMTGTGVTESFGSDQVVERPVGVGVAEVPVVVTEQERVHTEHHHEHHHRHEEVCGTKTFTEVEDRPIVKERVERILEHNPVEKQYVVETRFVGETAIPSATGATVIDTNERIVERAEPGPACPTGVGAAMDRVIDETRRY
ncbi:hypothetical protein OEZ86_005326 [Tetradesmus obliquus]|nr:hypothetical protein OEZ86_005326 [Tetradesmus obliquus]